MDVTEIPDASENLAALIRFHETGGHEGEGGDYTLMMARRELAALTTAQSEAADLRKEVERLRGALTAHNLRAANGDEITVVDELEQAAGTLEAFVEADKEHNLLDCCDNDGVEYQSEYMSGLMDHATINARTLRKWANSLRAALKETQHEG